MSPNSLGEKSLMYLYLMCLLILIIYLYLTGMWLGVAPRTCIKGHMSKKDQITCSSYDIHFGFHNQHNWGGGPI